jgi:hypothetical protein
MRAYLSASAALVGMAICMLACWGCGPSGEQSPTLAKSGPPVAVGIGPLAKSASGNEAAPGTPGKKDGEPAKHDQDQSPTAPTAELNETFVLGTDIASFYLYHPADLEHRKSSPMAWTMYGFACRPEFEAGRLVAFDTGGDGGYKMRVTTGGLTKREKDWLAGSWQFRLAVKADRVYFDGGYSLPSDDYDESDRLGRWLDVPKGKYRVTVHAIDWSSEPGAVNKEERATASALPSYVVAFEPVKDLAAIEVLSATPPRLECDREYKPRRGYDHSDIEKFEDQKAPLKASYFALVEEEQALVPGYHVSQDVSDTVYEAFYGDDALRASEQIERVVLLSSKTTPCLGAIAEPAGGGRSNNGPWQLSFHVRQLVSVVSLAEDKPLPKASVKSLDRAAAEPSAEALAELKRAFAAHATQSAAYRKQIKHPQFEADRVAAMTSPEGITHVLIHHVDMTRAERHELLLLPNAERVGRLSKLLAKPTQ